MNVSPDFCTINSINFLCENRISLTSDRAIPATMLIPGPAGLSSIRCAAQSEKRGISQGWMLGIAKPIQATLLLKGHGENVVFF